MRMTSVLEGMWDECGISLAWMWDRTKKDCGGIARK